jgi:hypothetical protein
MRFALITVVTLTLFGCSGERSERVQLLPTAPSIQIAPDPPVQTPTVPTPPARPPVLTSVWVVVTGDTGGGACIPGARVEIVRGQGLGRSLTQSTLGCSYWDPDYEAYFNGLNEGEELTLRASASGYAAKEITVVPTSSEGQTALSIVLSRIR